nr:hypothetical protein [uncultured Oscillibacter sp.]
MPKLIHEVRKVGASLNRILIIANARACWKCRNSARRWSGTGSWKYVLWTPTRKTDGR